jgi:DNA-directed RNA polymerase III subunit RPC1
MQSMMKEVLGKAQVIDNVPKVIKQLKFGAL